MVADAPPPQSLEDALEEVCDEWAQEVADTATEPAPLPLEDVDASSGVLWPGERRKKRPRDSSSPIVYGQKVLKRPAGRASSASGRGQSDGQGPGGAAGLESLDSHTEGTSKESKKTLSLRGRNRAGLEWFSFLRKVVGERRRGNPIGGSAGSDGSPEEHAAMEATRPFTPAEILQDRCIARTWNGGRGGQCGAPPAPNCRFCRRRMAKQSHGAVLRSALNNHASACKRGGNHNRNRNGGQLREFVASNSGHNILDTGFCTLLPRRRALGRHCDPNTVPSSSSPPHTSLSRPDPCSVDFARETPKF